ncbi:unnamed protein product, partial [Symbiodinium necroappetens]
DSHAEIVLCTCGSVKRSQTGGKDVSALFPRAVGLEPEVPDFMPRKAPHQDTGYAVCLDRDFKEVRKMVTAKEFTAKRLREFGESLLNEYEILLAGQLRTWKSFSPKGCLRSDRKLKPPEASVVRETSKNSNRVVVRGASKASTISGLVPKPPGTDSVNPITTPAEGSPWEGDLWKVQEDEANE